MKHIFLVINCLSMFYSFAQKTVKEPISKEQYHVLLTLKQNSVSIPLSDYMLNTYDNKGILVNSVLVLDDKYKNLKELNEFGGFYSLQMDNALTVTIQQKTLSDNNPVTVIVGRVHYGNTYVMITETTDNEYVKRVESSYWINGKQVHSQDFGGAIKR